MLQGFRVQRGYLQLETLNPETCLKPIVTPNNLPIEHLAELFHANCDRLDHKLWTVVAFQAESIMLRILLWQHKGLLHLSVVEIREIEAAVVAIDTT